MRLSANLGFLWPDRPLLERVDAAAAAGFGAIELHWPFEVPPERVREAVARNRIALLALNTAVGNPGEFGLGALPGREADFQATVDQALDYCRRAGGTGIHAMAGVVHHQERAAAKRALVKNLRVAADKADGLTVLIEPLNRRDRPGYFYDTIAEAIAVIEDVGAPNLRLMFDCYHVGLVEGNVIQWLERAIRYVGHVQIAAVPTRHEPDEGELDYRAVFDALARLDYDGWIGCEYRPRGDTVAGLKWIDVLASAFCRHP